MSQGHAVQPVAPTPCTLPAYNFSTNGFAILRQRKRHQHALLAATGLSAGRLDEQQSGFLQARFDVWAPNQFFLHKHLVPDFYNLEMRVLPSSLQKSKKSPKPVSNAMLWDLFEEDGRREAYNSTIFLSKHEHAREVKKLLQRRGPCPRALVSYTTRPVENRCKDRNYVEERILLAEHIRPGLVREFCASSLSRLFDIVLKLGYESASLIGVDLTSQDHFYTALPTYESIARRIQPNLAIWEATVSGFVRAKHGNTSMHATAARGVPHFIEAFSRAHQHRMRLTNLSPESLLKKTGWIRTVPMPQQPIKFEAWFRNVTRRPTVFEKARLSMRGRARPEAMVNKRSSSGSQKSSFMKDPLKELFRQRTDWWKGLTRTQKPHAQRQ